MLIWFRKNSRKVAYFFVVPLIFVFILLYGSSQLQERTNINKLTAVVINGDRVSRQEYEAVAGEVDNLLSNSLVQPDKSRTEIAMEQTIEQELARQLAEELGLRTPDAQVNQIIASQFTGPTGTPNQAAYQTFLRNLQFESHEQYMEMIRVRMDVQLALSYIRSTAAPSDAEVERALRGQGETRVVEMLSFRSDSYLDKVAATTEEVRSYFDEHRERYRFPRRMKLDYIEASPEDFVEKATPEAEDLERWFRSEREQFLQPAERDAEVIVFDQKSFRDQVTFTEEELQAHYEETKARYEEPEKFKVRFVAASVEVPDASIEALMAENPDEYRAEEEAVAARHILLRAAPTDSTAELEEKKRQIEEIRSRIVTEEDFIREAKALSEDVSNRDQGGDLGYFSRGRMVPAFEETAFSIEEATVSAPVKTTFGYHLIWTYDKRQPGEMLSPGEVRFRVLPEIDATPLKEGASDRLSAVRELLADASLAAATAIPDVTVYETDFFSRGEVPHEIIGRDRYAFYQAVAKLQPGDISEIVEGFVSYYLIELIDKQPARRQEYAEVRDKVETAYRSTKAKQLAREKAQEASNLIQSGTLSFAEAVEVYNLGGIRNVSGLRNPSAQQREENRLVDREIINRAFVAGVGEVEGPFDTLEGSTFLKVTQVEDEHLPDLEEVRSDAVAAYRQVLAERLARDEISRVFYEGLDKYDDNLSEAAESFGVEVKTTDFFRPGDAVPGFPANSSLRYAAAGLRVVGATSTLLEDPIQTPDSPPSPVEAYYLIQAATIEESRLPDFDEVKEQARSDLLLDKAAAIAKEEAEKIELLLSSELAASTAPFSASRSIDLKSFADKNGIDYQGPLNIQYGVRIAAIPGENSGGEIASTAFQLSLGQVSKTVRAVEPVPEGDRLAERVHGSYLVQLIGVQKDPTQAASRGEAYRALGTRYRNQSVRDWGERARGRAEIKFPNPDMFSPSVIARLTGEEEPS